MTRLTADFNTPNRGASCRKVRSVRQYTATSSTRSASGSLHGRPRAGVSAPSLRSWVTGLLKARGLSPVNGAVRTTMAPTSRPLNARRALYTIRTGSFANRLRSSRVFRPPRFLISPFTEGVAYAPWRDEAARLVCSASGSRRRCAEFEVGSGTQGVLGRWTTPAQCRRRDSNPRHPLSRRK